MRGEGDSEGRRHEPYAWHEPTEGGERGPTEHGRREPTEHGRREPTEHGRREPTEHARREPSDHGRREPSDHARREPTEHGRREPSDHGRREPTEHARREPSDHGRREPTEHGRREPAWAARQEHKQSHAGNGTVNHGPDDLGSTGEFDSDELALRRMLHQAVQEMEPRDGTLDHLRKAVPARRARKRQALVGMAAAALFFGTAIPAVVHVSSAGTSANTSNAGHTSQMQGGAGQGKEEEGGESTSGGTSGRTEDKGKGESKGDEKGKTAGAEAGASSGTGPSATTSASAPVCTAAQLGTPTASTAVPDSSGTVYGTFHITNGSTAACTVTGPGTVTATAQGAADSSKTFAARHVSGDVASAGLPDPSQEVSQLVLQPGSSYDVKFAWVPSETCPTSDPSTDPSTDPTASPDTTTSEGSSTGGDTGTSTQLLTEDGTADGSVLVTNTAEGGGPSVSTTVSNACAGTVYWTGLLTSS